MSGHVGIVLSFAFPTNSIPWCRLENTSSFEHVHTLKDRCCVAVGCNLDCFVRGLFGVMLMMPGHEHRAARSVAIMTRVLHCIAPSTATHDSSESWEMAYRFYLDWEVFVANALSLGKYMYFLCPICSNTWAHTHHEYMCSHVFLVSHIAKPWNVDKHSNEHHPCGHEYRFTLGLLWSHTCDEWPRLYKHGWPWYGSTRSICHCIFNFKEHSWKHCPICVMPIHLS